jgi:CHASE2 domain-containing sensor protein
MPISFPLAWRRRWLGGSAQRSPLPLEPLLHTLGDRPPSPASPSPGTPPSASPSTPDVFISYSRRDQEFVRSLHNALVQINRPTWVDWQDIMPTEQWWKAIEIGIETASNFVFILSPDSVASEVCRREVEHAVRYNKRLIPVVRRDVDVSAVHPALGDHNWIFLREQEDFATGFQKLVTAIDTDLTHVHTHTRVLIKALEWERVGRNPSFLLRGLDLTLAERWLKQSPGKDPQPTDSQIALIRTSRWTPWAKPRKRTLGLASGAVGLTLAAAHWGGLLHGLELPVYDRWMELRPKESQDNRLAIVEITEADVQARIQRNEVGRGTLSDSSLNRLLEILQAAQPRLIGLDIYRDFRADPSLPVLAQRLRQTQNLIVLCKYPELDVHGDVANLGVAPPPEVPVSRVGFSDVLVDRDGVLRRHVLLNVPVDEQAPCTKPHAFSLVLARRYLEAELGKAMQYQDHFTQEGAGLRLHQRDIPALVANSAGYDDADGGYQIMLSYRAGGVNQVAQRVSLGAVLKGGVDPAVFRDRIVLIGVTAKSGVNDYFQTPYQSMPGVTAQANMVSQLLSAVLDNRPLIYPLPPWADGLWIVGWAAVGGLIAVVGRSPLKFGLLLLGTGLGVVAVSYLLLGRGVWVPVVPAVLALVGTSGGVVYLTARRHAQQYPSTALSNRRGTINGASGGTPG